MPQYSYRGRDKNGRLHSGLRVADTAETLGAALIREGIYPTQITTMKQRQAYWSKIWDWLQGQNLHFEELAVFARQMQLLHEANVPITTALKQLSSHTRSRRLAYALHGVIECLEKGQSLATAMQYYPDTFSPLMVNIVQLGENSGHLSEAFEHLHTYLEFEASSFKQIKTAFRYPLFVLVSMVFAIISLNLFVIPTFARFYANVSVSLPWQTRILIGTSNFILGYYMYILAAIIISAGFLYYHLKTPQGKYRWDNYKLRIPFIGSLLKRVILIRFTQSFAITLRSGLSVIQSLTLVKNIIANSYIGSQISQMQEAIERGVPFTQAIAKVELFTPLEIQILGVGEKNGELSPALTYIGNYQEQEIKYDLKRMADVIGPVLIGIMSIFILIIALGVYLPVWNMINLVHS